LLNSLVVATFWLLLGSPYCNTMPFFVSEGILRLN
jgi:hypothetical protein